MNLASTLPFFYKPLQGIQVLLVDDNTDTIQLFTLVLSNAGAEVIMASSIDIAIKLLKRYKPEILISDYTLQDGNGYTLIREIKRQELDIRAILVKGYDALEEHQKALQEGFKIYLSIPVNIDLLISAVASLL